MSKSMVEKYEQILSADPGSMVFVELAKALLDRGEPARAIEVCQAGLGHHPESVVGRVLWGKALIGTGKPTEAMQQFDQAIAIDRENPYAYNLIGEVLLHKGLHRSALPILKKAVALQPNDTRVRQWLEQTTRALNGEKPTAQVQYTNVDASPAPDATVPSRPSLPAMGEPTVTDAKAYTPEPAAPGPASLAAAPAESQPAGEPELVRGMTDIFQSLAAREEKAPAAAPAALDGRAVPEGTIPYGKAPRDLRPPVATDPGAGAAPPARALEPTRAADDALPPSMLAPAAPANVLARDPATTVPPPDLGADEQVRMRRPEASEAQLPEELVAATLTPAQAKPDATFPGPPPPAPGAPALPDVGTLLAGARAPEDTAELPAKPPAGPPPLNLNSRPKMAAAPPPIPKPQSSLLPDLPAAGAATPSMELPKVELSSQAAEAIAKEYERELREKLAAAANAPKGFWALHGLKVGAAGLVVLLGVVGVAVFRYAKRAHANLPALMSQAHAGIEKDTASSYQAALAALSDLLEVSPDNAEAHALAAYAHALLYREHGQAVADRDAAVAELGRADVEKLYPELAAATHYYLADSEADRREAAKPLLSGKTAEAHEIAGKLLLDADPRKALEQFQQSLSAERAHVRTYLAIAGYYLRSGEPGVAQGMLDKARTLSDKHPEVLIDLAQARLAQGKELDQAAQDLAPLDADADKLEAAVRADLDLVQGQLLAARGDSAAGLKRLEEGLSRAPSRAVEFHQALADAHELAGAYDKALSELLQAQRAPGADKDLGLLDDVARAEIALGRPHEALRRTEKVDDRRIHLVRGIAYFEQGSQEAAKRELLLTRRDKSMPTEAAIYLARAEIASGHKDDAKPAIDAIIQAGKISPKAQVARGELMLANGDAKGATEAFTAASEDPREYEAPYLLGRVLLAEGKLADAQAPLEKATARNPFYDPAQRALGRLLLAEGDAQGARTHLSAYVKEHKDDAVALAGLARADLALGDLADAREFARQASRRTGREPEVVWTKTQVDLAAGDGSKVLRDLERRAKALRSADAWCDLGDAALDMGDAPAATDAFQKAAKMERGLARARVGLAVAAATQSGRSALSSLNALASEHLPGMLQARVLAAISLVSSGRTQKSKAAEAVAASDASGPAHYAVGVSLGHTNEAAAELSLAVALEPALAEAHLALAQVQLALGDKVHGVAEAEAAARIASHGPIADKARALTGGGSAPAQPHSRPTRGKGKHRKGK